AKGGLNVAVHPALRMTQDGKLTSRASAILPKANFSTVKANQKLAVKETLLVKKTELIVDEQPTTNPKNNPYFDSSIGGSTIAPKPRNPKKFKFAEPGKYINLAQQMRNQEKLEKLKQEIAESARKAGIERELELVANAGIRNDPPPTIEWWDKKLVAQESYENFDSNAGAVKDLINNLVQHPVPIEPPLELNTAPPRALILTKKEQKKLRRQNRLEAQREKQDKIRLGLLPPDEARVTKSNFMRVLGQEAILEPSKIEAQMAKQVADRQQKHKDLIASTKKTDEERREKKDRKLKEDTSQLVKIAVFKISRLDHNQHKFKINTNAQQYKLKGTAIISPSMNLVIVEGGPKGISAYKKLMLKRINWDDKPSAQPDTPIASYSPNECILVWEGESNVNSFKNFRLKTFGNDFEVKEYLEGFGVIHYWNAARTFVNEDY
ncbi:pre-mRNA processing factor 3-domain-containing protein, partial [Globomyces pollinis-pini]